MSKAALKRSELIRINYRKKMKNAIEAHKDAAFMNSPQIKFFILSDNAFVITFTFQLSSLSENK